MRRASRGRLEAPVSRREVGGRVLESWVFGCGAVVETVVAGGVEMPFGCAGSGAGEAIVRCVVVVVGKCLFKVDGVARNDARGGTVLACGSA
jgi:hypothetical protein